MNWEASEIVDQEVTSFRDNTPRMNTDEEAYHFLQYGHKWSLPPNQGRGGGMWAFIAIINIFRGLFKASDTFDYF